MKWISFACLSLAVTGLGCGIAQAQEKTRDTKIIEAELDRFRDDLFHAFNKEEYKELLEKYCHKDVIATWQDGTSSKGYEEVLAEFAKLKKIISKWSVNPTTDRRTILNDGNLVIASGNMKDEYVLRRGNVVLLNSRWEATLIRENERWVLVSFTSATDAFDNQVVDMYLLQERYISAAVAGVIGLIVGMVGTWLLTRRRLTP